MAERIYITGLFEMPRYVRELDPTHLISIIQPEFQPRRPRTIATERHLRVAVHDISESDGYSVLADADDLRRLLAFLDGWRPEEGSLLVHCYAGVSRSTAVALIAHLLKTGNPEASARALRQAAPYASPNRRIVALADQELELGGELVRAHERMGSPGRLPLGDTLAALKLW